MTTPFTIGSIASGMGMHLHGLKAIGGVTSWAIECDEAIAHCYKQNHNREVYIQRVEDIDPQELADVDLLITTLSCKNASISKGAKRGEKPEDIASGKAVANIIKAKRPKWFMLENVWGYRKFQAFEEIKRSLTDLGYHVWFGKLNLKHWAAQSRERLYLLASRDGTFPDPVAPKREMKGWYEAIADLIDNLPEVELAPWQKRKFPQLVESSKSQLIPDHSKAIPIAEDLPAPVRTGNQNLKALIKRVGGGRKNDRIYQSNEPSFTIRAVGRRCDNHSRVADAVVGDKIVAITPPACLRFFGDKETADKIWLPSTKSLANEVVGNGASWVVFRELFEHMAVNSGQLTVNSEQSTISVDLEAIASELIGDKEVTPRFRSYLIEYLHEAYGLRASQLQPDLNCFVNAQANTYSYQKQSDINNIAGDVQMCAVRANKGKIRTVIPDCKSLNFSESRVLFDSGAFPEVIANCRVAPEESLNRQLKAIASLPKFKETWIVSYDRLIDEKHIYGKRVKQRWTVEEGELAVKETIEAAKYLDSQRHRLNGFTLVQSCQGVDAVQYLRCVEQVLQYCRPRDVVGLGGWCILGRQSSYLQTFWETINLVIPAIAKAGITKVHIFGCTWYKPRPSQPLPPLQPLLWLCDQHGIELSTDGRSPISNALWTDHIRAGATFPYWRHNLAWVKAELATLRDSPLYQAPPGWEQLTVDSGQWTVDSEQWTVDSGQLPTVNSELSTVNSQLSTLNCQLSTVNRQLTTVNSQRHHLDFYESPSWFTTELLRHVKIQGVIGEPCVGGGAIASLLQAWPHTKQLWTNDIDPSKQADYHYDATLPKSWDYFPETDWIVTNPPYADKAAPIIKNAYQKASAGVVAFLLTSFLEPCADRDEFLKANPPSLVLTLPRYCFRKDKNGKRWTTDNSTISCFVWDKRAIGQRLISRPQSEIVGFYKNPDKAIALQEAEQIVRAIARGEISTNYKNMNELLTRENTKLGNYVIDQQQTLGVIRQNLGFGFTVYWIQSGKEITYNWERDSEAIECLVIAPQSMIPQVPNYKFLTKKDIDVGTYVSLRETEFLGIVKESSEIDFVVHWFENLHEKVQWKERFTNYKWEEDFNLILGMTIAPQYLIDQFINQNKNNQVMNFQFSETNRIFEQIQALQEQLNQLTASVQPYKECEQQANKLLQEVQSAADLMRKKGISQNAILDWAKSLYEAASGSQINLGGSAAIAAQNQEISNLKAELAETKKRNEHLATESIKIAGNLKIVQDQLQGKDEAISQLQLELEQAKKNLSAFSDEQQNLSTEDQSEQQECNYPPLFKGAIVQREDGQVGKVEYVPDPFKGIVSVKFLDGSFNYQTKNLKIVSHTQTEETHPGIAAQKWGREFIEGICSKSSANAITWREISEACQSNPHAFREIELSASTKIQKELIEKLPELMADYVNETGDTSDFAWLGETFKAKVEELLEARKSLVSA